MMDICKELNKLANCRQEKAIEDFFYDFHIDNNGEIKFDYSITRGWETIHNKTCLFNACDRRTNVASMEKEIINIKSIYKKLIEETA